jgi:type VI secretion system Hcp family effector
MVAGEIYAMKYIILLLLAVCALAFRPDVENKTYVSIKGSRQGQLKGTRGRELEGWFEIKGFEFKAETPGVKTTASGKRKYGALTIKKQADAASPKLLEALNTRETLEVMIQTVDDNNKMIKNITLKNALVTGIYHDDWENVAFEYTEIVTTP